MALSFEAYSDGSKYEQGVTAVLFSWKKTTTYTQHKNLTI